jgi:hypothetical protein
LSIEKSELLRALWRDFTVVFWGYSGADLKIDLDYLGRASAAPTAVGFFWNLFASRTYRETPNEFVHELAPVSRPWTGLP